MSSKDIRLRFQELFNNDNVICTEQELNEFLSCGLIIKSKNRYYDRQNNIIKIDVIENPNNDFNINLKDVINSSIKLSKENNVKKIFCMSDKCFNQLSNEGYIITKDNKQYYRYFDKELWLINKI